MVPWKTSTNIVKLKMCSTRPVCCGYIVNGNLDEMKHREYVRNFVLKLSINPQNIIYNM